MSPDTWPPQEVARFPDLIPEPEGSQEGGPVAQGRDRGRGAWCLSHVPQ